VGQLLCRHAQLRCSVAAPDPPVQHSVAGAVGQQSINQRWFDGSASAACGLLCCHGRWVNLQLVLKQHLFVDSIMSLLALPQRRTGGAAAAVGKLVLIVMTAAVHALGFWRVVGAEQGLGLVSLSPLQLVPDCLIGVACPILPGCFV